MDTIKKATARTKKFVNDHKVGIAVTVTSAFWLAVQGRTASEFNNFLKEKGLYDEYYAMDEDE